jgi:TonB family protein
MSFRRLPVPLAFATLSCLYPVSPVAAQSTVPALCAELPPPRSTERLHVSLALMAYDKKGDVRQKYGKEERAALLDIVQHLKSQLPAPPASPAPTTSSRFMVLDSATKTYMPVLSPEVSFTLDDAGTVSEVVFGQQQPGTAADTLFADVLRRIALDAKLAGLARRFGEKSVRLSLFTLFGRDSAGPKVAWAQTPYHQQEVPLYAGTDAKLLPRSTGPQYPQMQRNSRTNGEVMSKFTINPDGFVAPSTIRIVRATDKQFGDAVRAWLPTLRFMPATIGGCPVASAVAVPTRFQINY